MDLERRAQQLKDINLGLLTGLLLVLVTPLYAAVVSAKLHTGGLGWMGLTVVFFVVELAALWLLGRWAIARGFSPWQPRLTLALLVGLLPLTIQCAISWFHEGRQSYTTGALLVAGGLVYWFVDSLRRIAGSRRA